jgi:hypothetical protein
MTKISLTLASGDYDRVRPLWDGGVSAEGLDLNVVLLPVEEIFFRMVRYQEFDVAEMSMSSYVISKQRGTPRFVAIPVFPSRKFRHADIYIRSDSWIKKPEDLRGGRIGVPEYQMTAFVWLRGIFQEFYGVTATGFLDEEILREILRDLPEGTSELMCHPGFVDKALRQTPTRLLEQREMEYQALSQPGIKLLAKDLGVQLINYGDLCNGFYCRASVQ